MVEFNDRRHPSLEPEPGEEDFWGNKIGAEPDKAATDTAKFRSRFGRAIGGHEERAHQAEVDKSNRAHAKRMESYEADMPAEGEAPPQTEYQKYREGERAKGANSAFKSDHPKVPSARQQRAADPLVKAQKRVKTMQRLARLSKGRR